MVQFVFHPRKSRLWSGRYRLSNDVAITTVALGCTNKSVALKKLQAIVEQEERVRAGIVVPRTVRDAAQRLLADHLDDFLQAKRSTRDERYLYELKHRILKLISECGWTRVSDITPEAFDAWRDGHKRSAKTNNEYLTSIRTLLNWMVKRGGKGITLNPLHTLDMLPTAGVQERPRRAFSLDELTRLVSMSGERGPVYLVAAFTGLRRSELANVQRADLLLDAEPPRIIARANTTKNGKQARIRLHPAVLKAIRALLGYEPQAVDSLVFADTLPDMDTFRADLARAEISFIDEQGRRADFHSLRHTFCTLLQAAEVSERCAMELMRHSDRKLTNSVYTDSGLLHVDEAVLKLPNVEVPVIQIRTHEFVPAGPAPSQPVTGESSNGISEVAQREQNIHTETRGVAVCHDGEENARYRVRTCGPYRVKVMLYH